jgi:pimeloyl-ACP methyl ester carboxylesterase
MASARAQAPLLPKPGTLPPQKTALVFGQKITYYDVGTGPVLVLVHGFQSEALFDWGNVILPLSKHHRVLALDEIGWGQSDKPAFDYSVQTFVDFLGEYLRVMHVTKFDLAGESLGGWVVGAYTIQALAPENTGKYAVPKPSRLILEDAAGHTATTSNVAPVAGTLADANGIKFILYDKSRATPEFVREAWALKLKANDGNTQRSFRASTKNATLTIGDKLDKITIPTLVVWGGNDPVVPLADGKDYAAKIPNAKLVIIPECGHVGSMEKPAEFVAAAEGFLQ